MWLSPCSAALFFKSRDASAKDVGKSEAETVSAEGMAVSAKPCTSTPAHEHFARAAEFRNVYTLQNLGITYDLWR